MRPIQVCLYVLTANKHGVGRWAGYVTSGCMCRYTTGTDGYKRGARYGYGY